MNNSLRKVTVISKTHIELLVVSKEVRIVHVMHIIFSKMLHFLYKLFYIN